MSLAQGHSRQSCNLLAVLCGKLESKNVRDHSPYPFPELVSSGRLEVQTLVNPTIDEFQEAQRLFGPNFLYFQGEQQLENEEEIGNLVWRSNDVSDPETFSALIGPSLPTIVYLEVPNSEKIAQALHSKGVRYVIYWKNVFSSYAASHFRQALLSVIQSSYSHTWDAYQLANASFRLYCVRNNHDMPVNGHKVSCKPEPCLLGDAPKVKIPPRENTPGEEEQNSFDNSPAIKIHEDDLDVGFLVCGVACTLDACLLGSLEDGLSALLNVEIRGSRLKNRISAAPPPLAGAFSHEIQTMRCDLMTCSSSHISLLVSGSAQTRFDDKLLESYIKIELIEKGQLVHALTSSEEIKTSFSQPLNSLSIACGASVFEVRMKVPNWAVQILKQLAPALSYRSLVALGIASIHGTPVAAFEKEDADRLLFFCARQGKELSLQDPIGCLLPFWSPPPTKKMSNLGTKPSTESKAAGNNEVSWRKVDQNDQMKIKLVSGTRVPSTFGRQQLKAAAMRPIPHTHQRKMMPFGTVPATDTYDASRLKASLPGIPTVKPSFVPATPATHRKSTSSSLRSQQIISLNPLPMKKHGCDRPPIRVCSEEEFLRDVIQFLILRGHNRLVPQGGISEFPDAILNGKRLDLYNLYREVVSRGGFYVGNGINWKGQVFSKMHNHTVSNRMTGVGNTLKRHYETYLLEYELAHDDVDGECCLLCNSSTPGDWVNCGLCSEWAHFGCDRRQGLASFKEYAKTDGLEYICPRCSLKGKSQKAVNGFSHVSAVSQHV